MVSMFQTPKKAAILITISIIVLIAFLFVVAFICIMSNSSFSKANRIVPYDYPGSVWESDVPYIHLEVPNEPGEPITGYCQVDNEKKTILFSMTAGSSVTLFDLDKYKKAVSGEGLDTNAVLVKASCQYSDETIIMQIKDDMIFAGEYKIITLYKKQAD